jgi:hypothetical protein
MIRFSSTLTLCALLASCGLAQEKPGFKDTPLLPNSNWRVHDADRPIPPVVATGAINVVPPPSDAIVLFNGESLENWVSLQNNEASPPLWKIENGYFEAVRDAGALVTRDKFGSVQLHVEWASPSVVKGVDQARGNSGILLMGRYEVQVLDTFQNLTYADGHAGAIYGQYPPLVNASRPPGEWQSFDIVFEAPRFEGDSLVKPAYVTCFHNGVLVQNRREVIGSVAYRAVGKYAPHAAEEPLALQDHGDPVRFRNIWIRRLDSLEN